MMRKQGIAARLRVFAVVGASVVLFGSGGQAAAAPVWRIDSLANTTATPGGQVVYTAQIENMGSDPAPVTTGGDAGNCTPGSPPPSDAAKCITVTMDLPAGLTGASADGVGPFSGIPACTVAASEMTCTLSGASADQQVGTLGTDSLRLFRFTADVDPVASGIKTVSVTVSGGEAAAAANTVDPTLITPANPEFGIDGFDAQVQADAAGTPLTQAAGHPYAATTSLVFNTSGDPNSFLGPLFPVESTKDVLVDLPPGFVGNPTVADRCTIPELAASTSNFDPKPLCAPTSQVGTTLVMYYGGTQAYVNGPLPVFNMVPPPDAPARFGFNVNGTVVTIDAIVRSSDFGVTARVRDVSEGLAIAGTSLTLWGVPSDPVHDSDRGCSGVQFPHSSGVHCQSGAPRRAFLRNPTSCSTPGVGLDTTVSIDSWQHPGVFRSQTIASHDLPGFPSERADWGLEHGTEGCDNVPFDPSVDARPEAGAAAGAPAGFSVDLSLPQSDDPGSIGESDLKKAVVTLPEGVRVSPSSADGLQACSPDQVALHKDDAPTCPAASKIGSVTVDTPLLDRPLTGGLYLASPFNNPFNTLIAVYLVARGPGFTVKLAGKGSLDPDTGQITTEFDDNPQTPFTNVHIDLKSGSRAPLTMPSECGSYSTHAVLTGWNGRTVSSDSTFTVSANARGDPCPSTFTPGFAAGTANNRAGSSSSLSLQFTRDDEDQQLSGVTVNLPNGLTARIANATLCGEQDAANGTCPDSSKIGDVITGAGAGSNPFYITDGRAYITGPYKGAPFGASIVVHAKAGPFDLGNVVVRSALFVDRKDATVRIVTDPLPTILQGIPLDVRDVRVKVNKPDFTINPTSCALKTIGATVQSTQGARADVSASYQAVECANLGFKPRMVLSVGGRGHTHRGRSTPLTTTLRMPAGQANLRFVRVTLPSTINARLTVINDACTRAEFESDLAKCEHAKAGTATAVTPLLRDPLKGAVYFVKNGHPIPDLFIALRGQVAFDLIGRVTIPHSRFLSTTFDTVPDVPVTSFSLRLFGDAKNGSVGAAANLCSTSSRRQKAQLDYIGQNGRVSQVDQTLRVRGCGHTHRHHRRH